MKISASSPQQQAIVRSFLQQYDYALSIMEHAFEKTIQVCSNSITNQTAELHGAYLDLSKCLIQLKRYSQAIEQLTTLSKIQQPNQNAEAYLQRGIAKMRMFAKFSAQELAKLSSNRRPLLDINKAPVIEPNNAEAYLARTAW
ncbi:unnamed protein product [Rotaria sp. Silwood2]|nr:unnamed protein product [Rotaria sp. Silwood2]